jgi:transcriptional antiterminator RfaH
VLITLQWSSARRAPGTLGLVMDGAAPARVPDAMIHEIRARESNGVIEPPCRAASGDCVHILRGPFRDHLPIYAGMSAHERVAVLLQILGGQQRVTIAKEDVEVLIITS